MFLNSFWDLSGSWSGGSASPILSSKNTFQHKLSKLQTMWIFFSFYSDLRSPVECCSVMPKFSKTTCPRNRVARNSQCGWNEGSVLTGFKVIVRNQHLVLKPDCNSILMFSEINIFVTKKVDFTEYWFYQTLLYS